MKYEALECLDKPAKPLPKSCGSCGECVPSIPASYCGIDGTLCADKYVLAGDRPDWCPLDKPSEPMVSVNAVRKAMRMFSGDRLQQWIDEQEGKQ